MLPDLVRLCGRRLRDLNPVEPYLIPILAVASILLSGELLEIRRRERKRSQETGAPEPAMARVSA